MRSVKGIGLFIVIVVGLVGCSSANDEMEHVSLSGVVHDSADRPVENCSVNSTNRFEENAIMTDSAGKFETGVYPGKQSITVHCLDVKMKGEVKIEVPPSGRTDIQITVK
ncbi:hypothetical protein CPHO_00845 [Corynebacterium phocae]|uniref:Lipoprotein n=1 Tax=Corynebacterium phocae TaxID=161895 RepID=A0A1L7D106_9CORY|nr:carboxypeptidase-like regulatory domain-containing protein [Corynebacterium phocae]APT91712.1 hypothetical protein CPHO_00845 [Corynebacterium phocae]KAA8728618.1 carboxypeptidase regulatory-like domain-containing protein [Corynebacterium phocae]